MNAWADEARTGHVPRHIGWLNMQSTIFPKLEYPLPATTFTEGQCNEIIKPVLGETGIFGM